MKLKTKNNRIESARQAFEGIAKRVGVSRFERELVGGKYKDNGTAMDWRIFQNSKAFSEIMNG